MPNKELDRLTLFIPPETKTALAVRAAQERMSMSAIVIKALNLYYKKSASGPEAA